MCYNAQSDFGLSGRVRAASQRRTEAPLVLRNSALAVPAMAIHPMRKATSHLAAVFRFGPAAACVAAVERNDCRANTEFLPRQSVVVFCVIPGVCQQTCDGKATAGLPKTGGKLRGISAGAVAQRGAGPQIRRRVTHHGQLGPGTPDEWTKRLSANDVVGRDVMVVQPGGVDTDLGLRFDQAACVGNAENGVEEGIESPFFSRRSWAYLRVE